MASLSDVKPIKCFVLSMNDGRAERASTLDWTSGLTLGCVSESDRFASSMVELSGYRWLVCVETLQEAALSRCNGNAAQS